MCSTTKLSCADFNQRCDWFCFPTCIASHSGRTTRVWLAKVEAQSPDAICLAGDMIDRNAGAEDVQKFLDFVKALRKIGSRVFFSPGNHELGYMASDELLLDRIEKSGAGGVQ